MKNSKCCPKCHSENIVRVPDNPARYASGNNIYTTNMTLFGKIPVIRYVCCNCGYVENWVENQHELNEIKKAFGYLHALSLFFWLYFAYFRNGHAYIIRNCFSG